MAIKTISVSLADIERQDAVLQAAFTLAEKHDAHVTGIYVLPAVETIMLPVAYGAATIGNEHRKFF